jgi:hypothetical protein
MLTTYKFYTSSGKTSEHYGEGNRQGEEKVKLTKKTKTMKKLLFYLAILLSPTMAKAQWSITPEIGVLFSSSTSDENVTIWGEQQEFIKSKAEFRFKTGYSVGCKAAYKLAFGLKFSSGLYYTNERFDDGMLDDMNYDMHYEYSSLSMPVLLGYDYYLGNILLSANVGAAYNYGLTFRVNDSGLAGEYSRSAINIIADIGGGYKISEKLVLKLILDYSKRMNYITEFYGKPYHIGIKVGVEILL